MRQFLQSIPYPVLIPVAIIMALLPFHPKPHLLEKLQMLFSGELRRPVDIFDLCLHGAPLVLLLAKVLVGR